MTVKRPLACALVFLLVAAQAPAQTVSLENLTAQIDTETGQIVGFRALLADPDPSARRQ